MTLRLSLLSLPLLALAGCASFNQAELAQMPARGVPSGLVQKVERNRPLLPAEVATLSRRGVSTAGLVRYIHRNGLNYLLTADDSRFLRSDGVSPAVIDAMAEESTDFAHEYGARNRLAPGVSINDPYINYPDPNGFEW